MQKQTRWKAVLLILFLVTVWGVNWPLSKMALSYTPPLLFAGIRTLLGGLVLLLFSLRRYNEMRWKRNWKIYLTSSLFNIILFYGLQTVGLTYLPSGLFSAIVFLQPVLLGIFAWIWLGEPMFTLKIVGLILGFVGVATISIKGMSGHISAVGVLLALGTALSWAIGTVYVKKKGKDVNAMWLVTCQLLFGGLIMTGIGSGVESWADIIWNLPFISSLFFISFFVIAAGWFVFFTLVGAGEATKVASYTFLIPLIAIFIGTVLLHEPFTLSLFIGIICIVGSIYFVNRTPTTILKRVKDNVS